MTVVGTEPTALGPADVPSELGATAGQRNKACVPVACDKWLSAQEENLFHKGYQTVLPSPKLTLNTLYSKRAQIILMLLSGSQWKK